MMGPNINPSKNNKLSNKKVAVEHNGVIVQKTNYNKKNFVCVFYYTV